METESEQNSGSTNGGSSSGGSSRPQIAQMSLYERQAVQVRLGSEGLGSGSLGLREAQVLGETCFQFPSSRLGWLDEVMTNAPTSPENLRSL